MCESRDPGDEKSANLPCTFYVGRQEKHREQDSKSMRALYMNKSLRMRRRVAPQLGMSSVEIQLKLRSMPKMFIIPKKVSSMHVLRL